MRTILSLAVLLALPGCPKSPPAAAPAAAPAPPAEQEVPVTPRHGAEAFFTNLAVGGGSFNHDGTQLLIHTDATGVFNVYAQPVAGGEPTALTHSTDDGRYAVSWFPADDRFLSQGDQGGNELLHVFVHELDGTVVDVAPGEHRSLFVGWSGDRTAFYVATTERDPKVMDLYRHTLEEGYPRTMVLQNPGTFDIGGVSPDERWVSLVQKHSNADDDLFLADLDGDGALTHITPHEGQRSHRFFGFTPDSTEVWIGSDEGEEFMAAFSVDLDTLASTKEVAADWDVWFVNFSETGRWRVAGVNADAVTEVTVTDTTTGEALEMPANLPEGEVYGVRLSRDESMMSFFVDSDTAPPNLWVAPTGGGTATRLTDTLNPDIDPADLVEGQVVRYESFDGLEIPAILYVPKDASAEAPVPAVVFVHGGPGGQSRKGWGPMTQHLVNNGYAVLAVNNRGSSGYGRTFFHMDDLKHGDVDLQDCIWGRTYLDSLPAVDGSRVGIMGGSYGGYMVAAALAFAPEAFEVGIDIFGVTNWVRTLESIPPWWEAYREGLYAELGNPATDKERLTAISPLFHAENIERPLLVVQGANDPRVLQVESDELVEAVRASGVPVEYVVFDDEGHGFRKRVNRIEASEAYLQFLDTYLRAMP